MARGAFSIINAPAAFAETGLLRSPDSCSMCICWSRDAILEAHSLGDGSICYWSLDVSISVLPVDIGALSTLRLTSGTATTPHGAERTPDLPMVGVKCLTTILLTSFRNRQTKYRVEAFTKFIHHPGMRYPHLPARGGLWSRYIAECNNPCQGEVLGTRGTGPGA